MEDKNAEAHHWFNEQELRLIEAGCSDGKSELSATSYSSKHRKFNGSTGCACGGQVRSITIRTLIRRPQKGSGMVEYAMLLVFIAVAVMVGALALGNALRGLLLNASDFIK